jgi:hypothetical protein
MTTVVHTYSQVGFPPPCAPFYTQKWVQKWNQKRGLGTQNVWLLFRFWALNWVQKWYLPLLTKRKYSIKKSLFEPSHFSKK